MEYPPSQPVNTQQPHEGILAEPARENYDPAALGVECAWPVVEREALLALS